MPKKPTTSIEDFEHPSLPRYIRKLYSKVSGQMTGSLGLLLIGAFAPSRAFQISLVTAGCICFVWGSYKLWVGERKRINDLAHGITNWNEDLPDLQLELNSDFLIGVTQSPHVSDHIRGYLAARITNHGSRSTIENLSIALIVNGTIVKCSLTNDGAPNRPWDGSWLCGSDNSELYDFRSHDALEKGDHRWGYLGFVCENIDWASIKDCDGSCWVDVEGVTVRVSYDDFTTRHYDYEYCIGSQKCLLKHNTMSGSIPLNKASVWALSRSGKLIAV